VTAAEVRSPVPVIAPAWRELWSWACAQRADWDQVRVQGVLIGCKQAAVPYEDAAGSVWRLAWDLTMTCDDAIADLRRLIRRTPGTAGHLDPDVKAAALAAALAAPTNRQGENYREARQDAGTGNPEGTNP
jgi:hypothetical protein